MAIIVFGFAIPLTASFEWRQRETLSPAAVALTAPTAQSRHDVVTDVIAPASEAESPAIEPAGSGDVIQCRDASGGIQFTQGYCPPGTARVGSPKHD